MKKISFAGIAVALSIFFIYAMTGRDSYAWTEKQLSHEIHSKLNDPDWNPHWTCGHWVVLTFGGKRVKPNTR